MHRGLFAALAFGFLLHSHALFADDKPLGRSPAWVLWQDVSTNRPRIEPVSGYETRADCQAEIRRMTDGKQTKDVTVVGEGMMSVREPNGVVTVIILKCLPDSIDPRGPKQ